LKDFTSRVSTILKGDFQIQVDYDFNRKEYADNGSIVHENLKELSGLKTAGFMSFNIRPDNTISYLSSGSHGRTDFPNHLAREFSNFVYFFNAERRISAKGSVGVSLILDSDASNLVSVLHYLYNKNNVRFQKYLQFFREIFPEIHSISIPTVGTTSTSINGQNVSTATIELKLWNENPNLERDDLAISLDESGTGIGQILAMLYVVLELPRYTGHKVCLLIK
jgi:hypothetical protein